MLYFNNELVTKTMHNFSNGDAKLHVLRQIKKTGNVIALKEGGISNEDIMNLYFIKSYLDEQGASSSLILWGMPYQRMDHPESVYIATLRYTCRFIHDMERYIPFEKILIMEPHSEEVKKLLPQATVFYVVPTWISQIRQEKGLERSNYHLVFPDYGAFERYHDLISKNDFLEENVIIYKKKRDAYHSIIQEHQIERYPATFCKCACIIDDISSSGTTLLDVAHDLSNRGVETIYVIVAHCEMLSLQNPILAKDTPITQFFTSESFASKEELSKNTIVSIYPIVY